MNSKAKISVVLLSTVVVLFMVIGGLLGKSTGSPDEPYKEWAVYTEVLNRIRADYVEDPNIKSVTVGALHGMLEALDPFSSYLSPDQYMEYQKRKTTGTADIGVVMAKRFGYVAIISPIPGGPAAKAGLLSGDIIEAVDGDSTRDMSLEEVVNKLSGAPGSTVNISVVRVRRGEPQKIALKRETVPIPAVTDKTPEPGIGYVKIDGFPKGKSKEIAAHAQRLLGAGDKRLVIDVRGAAGGDISEGIATANLFLDHGVITYVQGQKVARETFTADASKALLQKVPIVVLVNRGTAGAAEVFASAILENSRGDVVGEKTYGMGSVQKLIALDDGSALILSVAKYYTPGGKAIQDTGVTPNVQAAENEGEDVQLPDEDAGPQPKDQQMQQQGPKEDNILKKALEVLKNQDEKKPATSKAAA